MALAAAMSCSMITGWANTAQIVSVTVGGEEVVVSETTGFTVTPEDLVKVKVRIRDTSEDAIEEAEATFLTAMTTAFATGGTLSDSTIEYVDQQTTAIVEGDTEAYAVFQFRPRVVEQTTDEGTVKAPKLRGAHTAKVGGTAVTDVKNFVYEVKAAKDNLTITTAENAVTSFDAGLATADVTYTITPAPNAVTGVTLGDVKVDSANYTYENGALTLKVAYLNGLAVGKYALVVSAQGCNDATLADAIVVNEAVKEDVAEGDRADVSASLKDVVLTPSEDGTSVPLPTDKVGNYDVKYEIVNENEGVEIVDGKITLNTDVKPFAKVEVKVYAGTGENCSDTKTVYLIPEPEKVAFGNVGLVADGANDAFAYDSEADATEQNTAFYEMVRDYREKLTDRVVARNLVLGKGNKADVPHFAGALDYDQDGAFNIAEYRIYKLMMDGNVDTHKFAEVNAARQDWIDKAKQAE